MSTAQVNNVINSGGWGSTGTALGSPIPSSLTVPFGGAIPGLIVLGMAYPSTTVALSAYRLWYKGVPFVVPNNSSFNVLRVSAQSTNAGMAAVGQLVSASGSFTDGTVYASLTNPLYQFGTSASPGIYTYTNDVPAYLDTSYPIAGVSGGAYVGWANNGITNITVNVYGFLSTP